MVLTIENEQNYSHLSKVDYLILGDSSAYKNIVPEELSPDSFSLALSGASAMDTYNRMIRIDLSKIKKGIILTNSFIHQKHYARDYWDRMVYFGYYSYPQFLTNYKIGMENKVFPSDYNVIFYNLYYVKTKLLFNIRSLQALWYAPASFQQKVSVSDNIKERMTKNKGWLDVPVNVKSDWFFRAYKSHYQYKFTPDPTDNFYMRKILDLTRDKKIPLYFIQGPVSENGHELVDVENYKLTLAEYMNGLAKAYPHFHFYQSKLTPPPRDFFDFYHLNEVGARKLSSEIKNFIIANP